MPEFLTRHALPFILACLVSVAAAWTAPEIFTPADHPDNSKPADYVKFGQRYFNNLSESPAYEREFLESWVAAQPLVIFGSSELTHADYKSIPYHFFTARGIPCMGIGSSGNQCLNILSQIGTHAEEYRNTRLVIILSPGWFDGEYCSGTPLVKFLSCNNESMLYKLNDNIAKYPQLAVVDDYVAENLGAVNSPSSVLRLMAYRSRSNRGQFAYAPFHEMHATYVKRKQEEMHARWLNGQSEWSFLAQSNKQNEMVAYDPITVDYTRLFDSAQAVLLSKMTNNQLYVEDSYYNEWMAGKPLKQVHPFAEKDNRELQDFYALVDFLKSQNMDVMFVMQPFNPYCFDNLPELDPTINQVRRKISDNGFFLADFYSSSTEDYKPGILSDIHHLSEAGWFLVDSAINQHFFVKP